MNKCIDSMIGVDCVSISLSALEKKSLNEAHPVRNTDKYPTRVMANILDMSCGVISLYDK